METVLKTILSEWEGKTLPQVIKREIILEEPQESPLRKAMVVTGFRRTGKTYLLFGLIKKLLEKYRRQEVIYLNFEDERIPQKTEILTQLIPTSQSLFGEKPKYLFLDGLQNIPNWSKWVRRILDNETIKLFVTGSSSKMSSFEIPSELRGRAWERKIYPLSFTEYLRFKNASIDKEKLDYLDEEKAKFAFYFNEYLLYGGLPEVVLTPEEKKLELLQGYFQTVVKREIIDRFQIRNEEGIKTVLKLLLNSTYVTVSRLYNSCKSLGLKVGKTTLNNYLSNIESSYFLKPLYFYSPSMRNQLQYPRKVYFIDNGFLTALSTKFSKNYGRLLENLIFWEFEKKNKEVFYYKDQKGNEVDFVIMEGGRTKSLYQVCWDISDFETEQRELKTLIKAGRKFGCNDLKIITAGAREELKEKVKVELINIQEMFI